LEVLSLNVLTITDDVAHAHTAGDPSLPRATMDRLRSLQLSARNFSVERAELLFRLLSAPALEQLDVRETSVFFWAGFRSFIRTSAAPGRRPVFPRLEKLVLSSTPMLLRTRVAGKLPNEIAYAAPNITSLTLVDMDMVECLKFLGGTHARAPRWLRLRTLALTGDFGPKEHILPKLVHTRAQQGVPLTCLRLDAKWMHTLALAARELRFGRDELLLAPYEGGAMISASSLGDADW
jgi:hypothetical protein